MESCQHFSLFYVKLQGKGGLTTRQSNYGNPRVGQGGLDLPGRCF
jgi:hypothetical protein